MKKKLTNTNNNIKINVVIFTVLSLLAKVIAFFRELLLTFIYGASVTSDVFLVSMTIPVTIFGFVSNGIASGFIPIYSNLEGKEKNKYTNSIINIMLIGCIIVIMLFLIFPQFFLKIFAAGFSKDSSSVAIIFSRITIWAILPCCIVAILSAFLQAEKHTLPTSVVSIPLNITMAFGMLAAYHSGNNMLLPLSFLIANIFQLFYILIFSLKAGFRISLSFNYDKSIKKFFSNLLNLSISSSANQINILIDRTIATTLFTGALSIYECGSRINDLLMGITIIPITVSYFTYIVGKMDNDVYSERVTGGFDLLLCILIPISIFACIFSENIVSIIYYHGAFDFNAVLLTKQVVEYYSIGLVFFGIREWFSKCFYSKGDVKTPTVITIIGATVNAILDFIFSKSMGIGGIALATSVSAILSCVLLALTFKKYDIKRTFTLKNIVIYLVFTLIDICIISVFQQRVFNILSNNVSFILVLLLYIILYLVFLLIFKRKDVKNFLKK